MRSAREEQGFALVTAIILLTVMMGLGLALTVFSDNQQKASTREQASESGFNVSEAALNAQVGQISRLWPGEEELKLPESCNAASPTTSSCPDPGSLKVAYPNISPVACPGGAPTEAWGAPLTNQWTTYVRDNKEFSSIFNSATEKTQPTWDANGDGKVWIRSVGVVQCHVVVLTTLVTEQLLALNFPKNASTSSWFKVTDSGKKVLVNTAGVPPVGEYGEISTRCTGVPLAECEQWLPEKEQINPYKKAPAAPPQTMSSAQLAALKAQAQATGTFHSAATGNCPSSTSEMNGLPAYVEGCGELKISGGVGNSATKPGFFVLADGTLELNGNAEFFGIIYARNPTNLNSPVVSLGGTAQIIGAINVDGNGGIEFGSSKANLIYEPRAIRELKVYSGAVPTRNTFRVLPNNQ
jgi:type II secretory pathway pseudopilin PulG